MLEIRIKMNDCHCNRIKDFFSVFLKTNLNETRVHLQLPGCIKHPEHFGDFEFEYLKPEVTWIISNYQCTMCNQFWYIEPVPEECSFPAFGVKLKNGDTKLTNKEIRKYHQDESIKAHDGFGEKKCNWPKCKKRVLLNRRRCEMHLRKRLNEINKKYI